MRTPRQSVLLSWSGGKDSALALARLRTDTRYDVAGLLTTVTTGYDRISIHGVRRSLLQRQAEALGLAVHEITIGPQSSAQAYRAAWFESLAMLPVAMADTRIIAFGDIFLADVREYREDMIRSMDREPIFPLWGESTASLSAEVLSSGFATRVVCVDTDALPVGFAGRAYDAEFLDALPDSVDPCGEHGEFHTFVSAGPGFSRPVPYAIGDTVLRDGRFAYCDLLPELTTTSN